MLRKKGDEYVIDRELTGKLAIDSNAELQEELLKLKGKHRRLEKQFKKLQVEHSRVLFDMDAVIEHEVDVKYKKIREENKKLKEELEQAIYLKVDYKKSYKQADAKKDELLEENKKLREGLEKLKSTYVYDAKQVRDIC